MREAKTSRSREISLRRDRSSIPNAKLAFSSSMGFCLLGMVDSGEVSSSVDSNEEKRDRDISPSAGIVIFARTSKLLTMIIPGG